MNDPTARLEGEKPQVEVKAVVAAHAIPSFLCHGAGVGISADGRTVRITFFEVRRNLLNEVEKVERVDVTLPLDHARSIGELLAKEIDAAMDSRSGKGD